MLYTITKEWLAKNAGIGSCFSPTGISYTDPDGISRTGGTGDVLNAFFVANMIGKSDVNIIASMSYSLLKITNGGQDITLDDVEWVYNNDGTGTEQKFCVGAAPAPTPTPTPTTDKATWLIDYPKNQDGTVIYGVGIYLDGVNTQAFTPETLIFCNGCTCFNAMPCGFGAHTITLKKSGYADWEKKRLLYSGDTFLDTPVMTTGVTPTPTPTPGLTPTPYPTPTPQPGVTPTPPPIDRAGVFEFVGPIVGDPTVVLNLSELQMRQAADRHFEMNGIRIINTSSHPVYIAMRIRLFKGDIPVCRDTGFVFDGMDRTDTERRSLRVKTLEVGESAVYNADFFQPPSILGMHTICMLIHGAWSRADLVDEVQYIVG